MSAVVGLGVFMVGSSLTEGLIGDVDTGCNVGITVAGLRVGADAGEQSAQGTDPEPGGFPDLRGAAEGECLYFGSKGFIGRHAGYGAWVYRIVALEDDGISVMDYAEGALSLSDPTPVPLPFSSGYGYPASHVTSPL